MNTRYVVAQLRYFMGEPRPEGWESIAAFDSVEKARKYIRVFGDMRYDYQIIKETLEG